MSINEKMKTTPFLVGISVIFSALVMVAGVTGRVSWWALILGCIGFGVAIAYQLGMRPFGRYSLGILVAWVLVLSLVSCAPGPVYPGATPAGGFGPNVPPTIIGAHFTHDGEDMECGIGLTQDAVGAVVSVFAPPVGFVAWLAWGVTSGDGTRADLQDCWNTSQANWHEFELMTQCWGQPVVTTTWTDQGAATQFVKVPFCQCNNACVREAMLTAAGWRQVQDWCRDTLNWFFCFGIGPNAAMQSPEALPPDQPLSDLGFAPAEWDTTAPAPEHPTCPDGITICGS